MFTLVTRSNKHLVCDGLYLSFVIRYYIQYTSCNNYSNPDPKLSWRLARPKWIEIRIGPGSRAGALSCSNSIIACYLSPRWRPCDSLTDLFTLSPRPNPLPEHALPLPQRLFLFARAGTSFAEHLLPPSDPSTPVANHGRVGAKMFSGAYPQALSHKLSSDHASVLYYLF